MEPLNLQPHTGLLKPGLNSDEVLFLRLLTLKMQIWYCVKLSCLYSNATKTTSFVTQGWSSRTILSKYKFAVNLTYPVSQNLESPSILENSRPVLINFISLRKI